MIAHDEEGGITYEAEIRLAVFALTLLVLLGLESLLPRRAAQAPRLQRTLPHFFIMVLNTLLLRLAFPVLAVGLAVHREAAGLGLLNMLDLAPVGQLILALILLDLAIYLQHVGFHKISFLWRFHRMHHADTGFDVTTGVRFHPGEIILSMLYKMAVIWVLGPSAVAVLVFEIVLSSTSLFNHANINLPPRLDRILRLWLVTPDMHRIHHSRRADEALHNFGFNLTVWDRLFGTYQTDPAEPQAEMALGTDGVAAQDALRLGPMLALPFTRPKMTSSDGYNKRHR